jgi:Transcriptional regulator/sugar kinase
MMKIAGIDVGGTKCAVILGEVEPGGKPTVIDKTIIATKDYPDPYKMIERMQQDLAGLLESHGLTAREIASIGISCGGPLDSVKGVVLSPPNLPGWDEIYIVKSFEDKFGVPAAIQNDANACALVEWIMGAGKGTKNMIFLTFGTGMGSGLILNGQLYAGTNDLGGEVGHIRLAPDGPVGFGKAGSFEGFCSGGGIAQLAKKLVGEKLKNNQVVGFCPTLEQAEELDAKTVFIAAQAGDPVAKEIVGISAHYLGQGLSVLIDVLNPECIVIGSIYSRNEELFKPLIEAVLKQEAIPSALDVCKIKPAELGDSIGDYAALCVAIYNNS